MSDRYSTDVAMILVPRDAAVPAANVTPSDMNALDSRLDNLENNRDLNSLTDVLITTPANGSLLIYNSGSGQWEDTVIAEAIRYVKDGNATVVLEHVDRLNFEIGLEAIANGASQVDVNVLYGGNGSANTASRSDHSHNATLRSASDISSTGVLSSGTRTLVTMNFGPLLNGIAYDVRADFDIEARNNVNAGTFNQRVQIQGGSLKSIVRRTVGGVPAGHHMAWYFGAWVGAGATITVTASVEHATGDPTDFLEGQLMVEANPRR